MKVPLLSSENFEDVDKKGRINLSSFCRRFQFIIMTRLHGYEALEKGQIFLKTRKVPKYLATKRSNIRLSHYGNFGKKS